MATPVISPQPASDTLTSDDRKLIDLVEAARRDGTALEAWCKMRGDGRTEFALDLGQTFALPNRAEGYFGAITLHDGPRSVMGVRQYVEFARVSKRYDAKQLLKDFVLGEFLSRSHWINADDTPGGFGIKKTLYETMDGQQGKFPESERVGAMDWRDIGTKYRWVLMTIRLYDFAVSMGPVSRRLEEAVCVTPRPEFLHIVENPTAEYALEVSIGYPFIEYAPIPNNLGFGPGKFGIAIKLFSFFITHDNRIRVTMDFAAAPRAQKIFDFWGLDPVYGGADLVDKLTLGMIDSEPFHDMMDKFMLAKHCHVHQKLMDGAAKKWEEWLGDAGHSASRS